MGKIGIPELLLVLAILLILFGGRKIPEIMRGMGEGIRNFKEGISGSGSQPSEKPGEEKSAEKQ